MTETVDQVLRDAADAFHKILAAHSARRLLDRDGSNMTQAMRDTLIARLLDGSQIERLCADSFERCTRSLAATGAADVTIHECSARDLEEHW